MSTKPELMILLLRVDAMPDAGNVLTWRVDGRPPTPTEVRLLKEIDVQDVRDLAELMRLELDVDTAFERDLGWSS